MNELSARALDTARSRGATYADVRIVRTQREAIQLKNGTVEALSMGEEHGFGVRVIADGAWGFASSSILTADEVDQVAALAVQIARASARVARAPVNLGPPLREQGAYRTQGGYGEAAYFLTEHWQLAGTYGRHYVDPTVTYISAANQALGASLLDHVETGAGLNYWLTRNFVVKTSYHHVTGNRLSHPDANPVERLRSRALNPYVPVPTSGTKIPDGFTCVTSQLFHWVVPGRRI